ncbi:uncharacterized protein CC84DRAFT_433417 [Paraphaeosphaeria sporulosa]|uniref:Uncharacterized protein n=1 Tax=Paraphaeosphaeria sporulosa TaxID=1460663 RepID=A0A177CPR5_9PLEO|nr:uncharacterized protein CC84DRAFT_433417 [Paraphaeosphaeria sporulosa]OAG09296.1 hypothetical protein CC84DRAFT_433417 [Paraphaeosphaeria sporulosa]
MSAVAGPAAGQDVMPATRASLQTSITAAEACRHQAPTSPSSPACSLWPRRLPAVPSSLQDAGQQRTAILCTTPCDAPASTAKVHAEPPAYSCVHLGHARPSCCCSATRQSARLSNCHAADRTSRPGPSSHPLTIPSAHAPARLLHASRRFCCKSLPAQTHPKIWRHPRRRVCALSSSATNSGLVISCT